MVASEDFLERFIRFLESGDFTTGERIGSERELAEYFGVARSRLRRALETLETEGRVRRTIGRAGGVFSWDGKIERQINTIESVPAMLRQQGFRPSTTLLDWRIGVPTPGERRALRLADTEPVLRLERRRDADGVPLSLEVMTLPIQLFPGLQTRDLSNSVYSILAEDYGIELADASETIDVVAASPDVADTLGIAVGDSVFSIRRVTYDRSGRPIEFAHDLFSAQRTRITLRKVGARWKRASGT